MFSLTKNIDAKVAYILEELSNNNMRVNVKIPLQKCSDFVQKHIVKICGQDFWTPNLVNKCVWFHN